MVDARISVWLTPRAREEAIVGWQGDALRVRVAAPPVDNRANDALVRLLARRLGVPAASFTVTSGRSSRRKTVRVDGLSADDVRARLA